jgi:hypothetical protein
MPGTNGARLAHACATMQIESATHALPRREDAPPCANLVQRSAIQPSGNRPAFDPWATIRDR